MARGWESKSVESQIADGGTAGLDRLSRMTPEQRELAQRRESLELSRRRIARELEESHSPVHRTALTNALEYLDEQIRKLS